MSEAGTMLAGGTPIQATGPNQPGRAPRRRACQVGEDVRAEGPAFLRIGQSIPVTPP